MKLFNAAEFVNRTKTGDETARRIAVCISMTETSNRDWPGLFMDIRYLVIAAPIVRPSIKIDEMMPM